uniref:Uncharacterized protein n=1 Tax=Arundo donax TaxID=35708 RepID=A0A0A9DUH8_ARUDO
MPSRSWSGSRAPIPSLRRSEPMLLSCDASKLLFNKLFMCPSRVSCQSFACMSDESSWESSWVYVQCLSSTLCG